MDELISKQEVLDALDEIESEVADGEGFQYEKWRKFFAEMQSVEPKQKLIPVMTLEETIEKLKPCPFCGSGAKLVKTQLDEYKIFCLNDRCDASYGWCVNQKRAVEGWNRRAGENDD